MISTSAHQPARAVRALRALAVSTCAARSEESPSIKGSRYVAAARAIPAPPTFDPAPPQSCSGKKRKKKKKSEKKRKHGPDLAETLPLAHCLGHCPGTRQSLPLAAAALPLQSCIWYTCSPKYTGSVQSLVTDSTFLKRGASVRLLTVALQ